MYEVPLPHTDICVRVRGMTLAEEMRLRSWIGLLSGTAYDFMYRLLHTLWKCVEEPQYPTLDDFASQLFEDSLVPLLYAFYKESVGDELVVLYTCGDTERTATINLNNVETHGEIEPEPHLFECREFVVKEGVTFVVRNALTLADSLCILAVTPLNLLELSDPKALSRLSEENMVLMNTARTWGTVLEVRQGDRVRKRPSLANAVQLRRWFTELYHLTQDVPARKVREIKPMTPSHTIKMTCTLKCRHCGDTHSLELDVVHFFRVLVGLGETQ